MLSLGPTGRIWHGTVLQRGRVTPLIPPLEYRCKSNGKSFECLRRIHHVDPAPAIGNVVLPSRGEA